MRKYLAILAIMLVTVNIASAAAEESPELPHAFFGTVKDTSGDPASANTKIIAVVNGVEAGRIVTSEEGKYGSEDPGEEDLIVGARLVIQNYIQSGDEITFYVNGTRANEKAYFESGEVTSLNLTVPEVTADYEVEGSATGDGNIILNAECGVTGNLTAKLDTDFPDEGKPENASFPFGMLSFDVRHLCPGPEVNITLIYPSDVPTDAQYWKYQEGKGWYTIPFGSNDGDNVITIQLTDGGTGDADNTENGVITDPGGIIQISTPTPTTTPTSTPTSNPQPSGGGGSASSVFVPEPTPTPTPTSTPAPAPTQDTAPPVPTATPTVTASPTPEPATTTETPVPAPSNPWWTQPTNIIAIIAILVAVIAIVVYAVRR